MIRGINIAINAAHPELPLVEATTFVGSPSSVFVRGVPKSCGNWRITAVSVAVTYPDNTTTTRVAMESAQGVWVATIPGTATSGRTIGGFRILADGEDENGAAVTGYVLGFADFAVFSMLPVPAPGETFYIFRYFDAQPATPKKGDAAIIGGVLKYYNGTAWTPFADLSDYKPKQTAVADPTSSGTATAFIDAITQDANGVITPTKKALPEATTSVKGIVQLAPLSAVEASPSGKAADAGDVKSALNDKLDTSAVVAPSTASSASRKAAEAKATGDALALVAPEWASGNTYAAYDAVKYNGAYYYAKQAIANSTTAPSSDTTNWGSLANLAALAHLFLPLAGGRMTGSLEIVGNDSSGRRGLLITEGSIPGLRYDAEYGSEVITLYYNGNEYGQIAFPCSSGVIALLQNLASNYSTSGTYALNALCVNNGVLYRCKTAITTAEAWTAAHWDVATVEDVLAAIRTALDGKLSVGSDGTVSTSVKLTGMDIARLATLGGGAVAGNFMRFRVGPLSDDYFIAPAYDATAQKYGFWVKNGANDAGTFYALADFAPLASPAFSGTPTAPTPTDGDDSTKLATTAFVQGGVRYDLGTATTISTASQDTSGTETIDYGAATLANRTANLVQITTALDELRITFPAATSGKVRDFGLRVEIGTGSAALTAPALVPIAPTGETIKIENNAKEIPALADGTATAKGVTLLYFSENAPGIFVVKGEQVEEVA